MEVRTLFSELVKFRALVKALVQRHLAVRYRGSALGFLWSILNPLCLMAVYVLVFHYYMRSTAVSNYPIFLFCGLLPWIWTSSSLLEGTSSIVGSGHLITKSLFPAQVLPAVAVLTTLVNFILSLPILALFMYLAGVAIPVTALFLPVLILIHGLLLFGLVLILAALNVRFRDVQHLLGNLMTFLFFLCPIVYPASLVPEKLRFTLFLNPFALITQLYQRVILDGALPITSEVLYLLCLASLAILIGAMVFSRNRESFAEML